ncbi:hypothetical protein H8711_05880 [Clostridiaceae bacterium NSJ-31]|uniref:Phage major capsid protein n=1 Tax=Ligaoa zhengdingensis TaxID=2763658 RepID=A0A926DZ43_9FIRM|nr:hypothetical protein [Ligaoa zhengdingensis]MBC8546462.1 hypothetical protein [Ligaoa zhengdingensis]
MAINTFAEKALKFLSVLDEVYALQSKTANLDNAALTQSFVGTNKIKLPKISVDGAGNYDRDAGYAQGGVSVSYEEHTLKYDRGRKFRIDVVDDDESAFALFRQVTLQYVRTREIPEIDAIRFMEIYNAASRSGSLGTVVEKDLTSSDKALALFDAAEKTLNEKEVPEEGRVLYCTNDFYEMLKNTDAISRRLDVNGNNGDINRRVAMLDGITPIIKVPQVRFYSKVKLLDGTSESEKKGGYEVVNATTGENAVVGTKDINFIYANRDVLRGVVKRNVSKIVTPEQNQSADAYDVFYRIHHDLIVRDNETAAIYVHTKKTAHAAGA